jgi:periplasmic divalent cation tolerance protein
LAGSPETFKLIYVTAQNMTEARSIAETIVQERLVACVNILPGVESIYHWEGKVCKENEAVLIAKTRESLVSDLIDRVTRLHRYEVPCIIAVPIADGNPAYLRWIGEETKRIPQIK